MDNIKKAVDTLIAENGKAIPKPSRVRVAAYVRVDSGSQEQSDILKAQVDEYAKLITAHDGWKLVDIYADEGPAGEDASCRKEFNRMLQDCRAGKIDRILVRSASRFSRSAQECIRCARELLQMGVTIYFEKENLDTGDEIFERAGAVYTASSHSESAEHLPNQESERTFTLTV